MECCFDSKEPICPVCGRVSEENLISLGDNKNNTHAIKQISILDELSGFKFTDDIKIKVTQLYQQAAGGKTKRNGPRRATIYHCLIAVCKQEGVVFNRSDFQSKLNIKTRDINKASKSVRENVKDIDISITTKDIVRCLLKEFDMKDECIDEIMKINNICAKSSPLFNSSKMETIAASLVYHYLNAHFSEFKKEEYFRKSSVSKDTILTINEEIIKYLETKK